MGGSVGAAVPVTTVLERKRHSPWVQFLIRLVKEKPLGTFGAVIVLVFFVVGVFAELIAPYGMNEIDLVARLAPPSAGHILGTDNLGRDLFTRIIFGARVSMIIGVGATVLSVVEATIIGLISGFFGGKADIIIQRFVDAWVCFPTLFILLTVMAVAGGGMIQVLLVLGLTGGIGASRLVRSAVMAIKGNTYVEAARAIGAPTSRILMKHLLPNVMATIIVLFSISIGGVILTEASLSFLGFGINPPTPSWGGMLSGPGRYLMLRAPWLMVWPGACLTLVVYGTNMLGDAVRDILDPRLRGGLGRYGRVKTMKLKRPFVVEEE